MPASMLAQSAQQSSAGNDFFEKKIRPVLATRCYPCHSAAAPKVQGGFQLDSRDAMRKGGNSGPPIVPGDPDSSLLIKALRYTDASLQMPPGGKPLPPEVIADFEAWVKMGAPDPRTAAPKSPLTAAMAAKKRDWWAFKAPVKPTVPQAPNSAWVKTPVDAFVLRKLTEAKLTPSAAADRRTLIRRATFDLIGLPPTQKEVDDFVNDKSPDAWERVVDRLLASPHYGERWARHWMDVSRYADTADGPQRFAFSYTYRDWLIRAFNEDMPYNDFVRRQIAADKMNLSDKHDLAALGFITLGRSVPKGENDMIDDRIDAITRGFLAMTVTCARCHDHKFDPIPTRDYYSLYGIIRNSIEPVEYPLLQKEDENSALVRDYRDGLKKRLEALDEFKTKRHAELVAEFRQASWIARYMLAAQKAAKFSNSEIEALSRDSDFNLFVLRRWRDYLNKTRANGDPVFAPWNALAALPADQFEAKAAEVLKNLPAAANPEIVKALSAAQFKSIDDAARVYGATLAKFDSPNVRPDKNAEALRLALRGYGTPTNVPLADFIEIRGPGGDDNILRGLEGAIRVWEAQFAYRGITPRAQAIEDSAKPEMAHVFLRGNPNNPGIEAPPHFLTALTNAPEPPVFTHGSGRIDLANAIVDPKNPVTARVIVNRVWAWHFGRGIVNTPSDFGTRGDLPTHPELLDYLAVRFMEEGWSIKKLQKWIMLSGTYQQSSMDRPDARGIDPENKLVWRMNRQRLDFESLRDATLFAAGQLDPAMGSVSFSLETVPAMPRRTLYAYIQRGRLPGELTAFDFATPEAHVPVRFTTTVPQQALFLMNSPFVMEEARHLMERPEVAKAASDRAKVEALYSLLFGRKPSADEVAEALAYVKTQSDAPLAADPQPTWQYGLAKVNQTTGAISDFEPMKYFAETKWQPASITPQRVFGNAELSAKGGWPTDDPNLAIVRRWVSAVEGTVEITATLKHEVKQNTDEYRKPRSDGVRARIVRNLSDKLAEQTVNNGTADLALKEVSVKPGDTIDFVVDCVKDSENDNFTWAPVIKAGDKIWDATKDFAGPAPLKLNAREKYAQVLLETNEFAFVD